MLFRSTPPIEERAYKVYKERIDSFELPDMTKAQKDLLNEHLPEKFKIK